MGADRRSTDPPERFARAALIEKLSRRGEALGGAAQSLVIRCEEKTVIADSGSTATLRYGVSASDGPVAKRTPGTGV